MYSDRHNYKLANVHIRSQTPVFTPSQRHRNIIKAVATSAAAETKIRLSDGIINITIIGMKTKAAF